MSIGHWAHKTRSKSISRTAQCRKLKTPGKYHKKLFITIIFQFFRASHNIHFLAFNGHINSILCTYLFAVRLPKRIRNEWNHYMRPDQFMCLDCGDGTECCFSNFLLMNTEYLHSFRRLHVHMHIKSTFGFVSVVENSLYFYVLGIRRKPISSSFYISSWQIAWLHIFNSPVDDRKFRNGSFAERISFGYFSSEF